MTPKSVARPRPFTPSQEDPDDLDRRTVGRDEILRALAERLESAANSRSRPHTLLVGPRGSGKTHLLRVALHRATQNESVRAKLAIADISEDAVGITRYTDLMREIGSALGVALDPTMSPVDMENAVLTSIGDKTLVLVFENLDRVFDAIGTAGQQNLRSWMETSGRILILAATPALFAGVSDRRQPWFGGLAVTPVDGLTSEDGHELLTLLARQRGDDALADFLETPIGRGRIEAVAQLTGGSARIWMVLSECLTIENLDALIPAVEALVESLVPYYQQLLWDLPNNHQAVVRQLAEGPAAALTASDIADACGMSQQTVSKALGLLQEGRWVQSEKVDGNRRKTWYRLREPMLRHHFQWRSTRGEPLLLIVELLKAWYQPEALRQYFAGAQPLSEVEHYLLRTLSEYTATYEDAYNDRDVEELISAARRWINGESDVFDINCGRYIELCVTVAENPASDPELLLQGRAPGSPTDSDIVSALAKSEPANLVSHLKAILPASAGATQAGIAIIAARWIGPEDAKEAYHLLSSLTLQTVHSPATAAAVRLETLHWLSQSGEVREAFERLEFVASELGEIGPDHPVTLSARSTLADLRGQLGDPLVTREMHIELLDDRKRVLGDDHRDTLNTRAQVAYYTGESGRAQDALDAYRELLGDRQRVLGPGHPDVLATRSQIAYYTGECGDTPTALNLYSALLTDTLHVHGPDHWTALTARHQIAFCTQRLGDAATALEMFRDLLEDTTRVLGRTNRSTLANRAMIADCTARTGDLTTALEQYDGLLADRLRVLGPDHPDTLAARSQMAYYTGAAGDAESALRAYRALRADTERIFGLDHRNTLTARHQEAFYTGRMGDPSRARTLYESLLSDRQRVLGLDHPDTMATHIQIADQCAERGDIAGALATTSHLLSQQLKVLGAEHRDTLATRARVAYYTAQGGDPAAALSLYEVLLEDRLRLVGPHDPDTFATRAQIAYCITESGDPRRARSHYRDTIGEASEVLGSEHPTVSMMKAGLAVTTSLDGEVDEAIDFINRERLGSEALVRVLMAAPAPPTRNTLPRQLWFAFRGDDQATAQLPIELRGFAQSIAESRGSDDSDHR